MNAKNTNLEKKILEKADEKGVGLGGEANLRGGGDVKVLHKKE